MEPRFPGPPRTWRETRSMWNATPATCGTSAAVPDTRVSPMARGKERSRVADSVSGLA